MKLLALLCSTVTLRASFAHSTFLHVGCDDAQDRARIEDAINGAQPIVQEVLNARWARPVTGKLDYFDLLELDQRYFGVGNAFTRAHVTDIFERIQASWHKVTYHCHTDRMSSFCGDAAAYVDNRNKTHMHMHICPAFHEPRLPPHDFIVNYQKLRREVLPEEWWYGKEGCLIHEMTHFSESMGFDEHIIDVPGTMDCFTNRSLPACEDMYEPWNTQEVAFYSTDAALLNADNYARYALAVAVGGELGMPRVADFD